MQKKLISIVVTLLVVLFLGGFFLLREQKTSQENSILPEVTENHSKSIVEQTVQQLPQTPPSLSPMSRITASRWNSR